MAMGDARAPNDFFEATLDWMTERGVWVGLRFGSGLGCGFGLVLGWGFWV